MKAAMTPRYGPAKILHLRSVPTPEPGPEQVLIRVHATHVTAGDLRLRSADFPGISAIFGRLLMGIWRPRNQIQGTTFAGEVVAIGSAVTKYRVGQRIFGSAEHGAYAECLVAEQDGPMAPIPAGRSYAHAAALPYGAGTALHFLRDVANLQPGERVLILGATGGVGRFAVQLAQHMGAVVTAVGRAAHFGLMRSLGADHVLDYTRDDFREAGHRYDLIFDIADASSFRDCKHSLTPNGRYLSLYIQVRLLLQMACNSMRRGKKAFFSIHAGNAENTAEVADLFAQGVFAPVLAQHYDFDDIVQAHEAAEARNNPGAVVVQMMAPSDCVSQSEADYPAVRS